MSKDKQVAVIESVLDVDGDLVGYSVEMPVDGIGVARSSKRPLINVYADPELVRVLYSRENKETLDLRIDIQTVSAQYCKRAYGLLMEVQEVFDRLEKQSREKAGELATVLDLHGKIAELKAQIESEGGE